MSGNQQRSRSCGTRLYTAASVLLTADALAAASPASALFVDHDALLPPLLDTSESAFDRD